MPSLDTAEFWTVNWVTDCLGRCIKIDPEWENVTGQPVARALGQGWLETFCLDDLDEFKASLKLACARQRSFQFITKLHHISGHYRWTMAVGSPKRDKSGACKGIAGALFDLHERVEAESEFAKTKQRLEALMDAAPVGLSYSRDASCAEITGNKALFDQFETNLGENISASSPEPSDVGRQIRFYKDGRELTDFELPLQTAVRERRRVDSMQFDVQLPSGRRWVAEASAAPIVGPDGSLLGGVAVTLDVTSRNEADAALKRSEAQLAAENIALSRLNDASARLWKTSELREGLEEMLSATMELLNADMGNVQLFDEKSCALTILAHRGFDQDFLDFFSSVSSEDDTACGRALRAGERIVIEDVEADGSYAAYRAAARTAGYCSVQSTPLIGRNGKPSGVLSTHWRLPHRPSPQELRRLDLYARQAADFIDHCRTTAALKESEERFRTLTQSIPSLSWETDANGMNTFVSKQWLAYTGMEAVDVAGSGWTKALHPDDRDVVFEKWIEAIGARSEVDVRYRMKRSDGVYRWFLTRATPHLSPSGEVIRWVGTSTDIDELVQAQISLAEVDKRKDEFIATLAHELRNPLSPIRNAVHVIRSRSELSDPRLLDILERQVEHLVRLVDDLLEVSRINCGKIELRQQAVAVSDFLRAALESSQSLIDRKGHEIAVTICDEPIWVHGDPIRLAQILANVIHNASKYTAPGGRIEIEVKRKGGNVALHVRDSGVGICPETMPRIFDLFVQSDRNLRLSEGGLGIGLALTRKLLDLQGGDIVAHSDGLGKGSEFVITLPVGSGPSIVASARAESAVDQRTSVRALVIDDDRDVAEGFSLLLESLGANVHKTSNGRSGVEAIDQFDPDLVFVDIGMPGLDGYETARQICQRYNQRRFTLIALTGWGQAEDRRRSQEVGFDLHLTKPAPISVIERILLDVEPRASRDFSTDPNPQ